MGVIEQITELKEERAKRWEENKDLVARAESEERDLTAEEAKEYDDREAEMDSLEKRAARLETFKVEPRAERRIKPGEDREATPAETPPEWIPAEFRDKWSGMPKDFKEFQELRAKVSGVRPQDDPEYRFAFMRWLTEPDDRNLSGEEKRVLSKASAGAGLNLVPTDFARQLVDALRDFGVMRQISRVITTDNGDAFQIPSVSSHGTASWTAENAAFTASDEAFGQATLNAYKAATLMKVSEELLADSAFDLEAYARTEFGSRIGVLENTAYVVGDGSGKPTGVSVSASAGATAASATALAADDLVNMFHALSPPYRRNAVWVLNDAVIKAVRKIKTGISGDTTYIWQPGLQAGAPDTLLGKPVYADPDMNGTMTTGLIVALFGDFSYYWIRDVNGIAFQKLVELYAENGQVGFRAYHRTDGKLMNTAAVKKLVLA